MLPLITPPDDEIPSQRLIRKAMAVGALVAILFGMMLSVESPIVAATIGVILAMVVCAGLVVWVFSQQKNTQAEKAKRGLDGLDMYSLIDRLVDEIDDDEAAYLRRRLEERDHTPQQEVAASIEELLDKRAQEKQR
jgi:hypothetical protein